jgi:pimeloyl-ACP methyl ester carboxylesterase
MLSRAARALLRQAAAAFDRAATQAAYAQSARRRRDSRSESLGHEQRIELLEQLKQLYDAVDPARFFRGPRAIEPSRFEQRRLADGGRVYDLRWPSAYRCMVPEVAERYESKQDNTSAAARLWLHPGSEPRPVIVLIHGYLGGRHGIEERMWPTSWLYDIGLDLALFVLPFHGVRAVAGRRGAPPFPGSDPRVTVEGFRQAMGDLADLVSWLSHKGHPHVGVMGMSLGGYSSALAATALPELSFAIPVIPLTSLADFAREQGRLGSNSEEEALEHEVLESVYRLVSPLHRSSLIERQRMMIIAAEGDRITPISHAERLAKHFDVELDTWHGGHLLQFGRSEKFREVGRFLNRLSIISR